MSAPVSTMNADQIEFIDEIAKDLKKNEPICSQILHRVLLKERAKMGVFGTGSWKLRRKRLVNTFNRPTSPLWRRVPKMLIDEIQLISLQLSNFTRFHLGPNKNGQHPSRILLNVAEMLESSYPETAYSLIQLSRNNHPGGEVLEHKEKALREKLFGLMLTARKDGTTQRLNAIVLGSVYARKSGIPFKFSWATNVGAIGNSLGSVSNKLPEFFREEFVEEHYIGFDAMKRYKIWGFEVPLCEFASGRETAWPISAKECEYVKEMHLNFVPHPRLSPESVDALEADLASALRRIFRDEYITVLEKFKTEVSDFIGIHYRGGDVVYGSARHGIWAITDKTVPLPVIEHLINMHRDKKVLLFGTPVGQTLDDLKFLKRKYSNVFLSHQFCDVSLNYVVQDSMLMSCCEKTIACSGSGVAQLARLVSPRMNLQAIENMYAPKDMYELYISNIHNTEYNDLQRSFINVRALALCYELDITGSIRDRLTANIKTLDPGNRLRWLKDSH